MNKAIFSVSLGYEDVLLYYKGMKDRVQITTRNGISMSLPYSLLLDYVTKEGIYGTFEISYADDGQLGQLKKLS